MPFLISHVLILPCMFLSNNTPTYYSIFTLDICRHILGNLKMKWFLEYDYNIILRLDSHVSVTVGVAFDSFRSLNVNNYPR